MLSAYLDTVYERRKNWLARGLMSLADKHRRDTPPKLNEGHKDEAVGHAADTDSAAIVEQAAATGSMWRTTWISTEILRKNFLLNAYFMALYIWAGFQVMRELLANRLLWT